MVEIIMDKTARKRFTKIEDNGHIVLGKSKLDNVATTATSNNHLEIFGFKNDTDTRMGMTYKYARTYSGGVEKSRAEMSRKTTIMSPHRNLGLRKTCDFG